MPRAPPVMSAIVSSGTAVASVFAESAGIRVP
ncbi:Uncharacterised protein [Mycobacteroides abscessus subsp. abscessus]|nr:Uncharacterised protein [Mycobacteroides abscessus subsp. abscessus]